ncbi:glycosyl hydrolase 53 family protein [Sphingomonas sp. FW199]|uniref:glycosyl hydrolase 53 family protein n=1 Tax=Sphingomonas sp. FW199 TaxID=3400217 RepID=UPI003CF05524
MSCLTGAGYPATPERQRDALIDLTQTTVDAGGIGLVCWEPNWVSTRWGKGSNHGIRSLASGLFGLF